MKFFKSETSSDIYSLGFFGYLSFQQSSTEFNDASLKTMKMLFHTRIVFLNFTGLHWQQVSSHGGGSTGSAAFSRTSILNHDLANISPILCSVEFASLN